MAASLSEGNPCYSPDMNEERVFAEFLMRIINEITSLHHKVDRIMLNTAQLTAAVQAESTVIQSAVTAINGFPGLVAAAVAKALSDAGIDDTTAQAAVDAATAQATSDATALTTALTANTPTPAPAPTT